MSKKPDDAAKIAGLANILQSSNKPNAPPPAPPKPDVSLPSPAAVSRQKERIGKYRDPAFKAIGLYVRKDTLKRVKRKLEDLESAKDLSELTEELFLQWLSSL